MISEQITQIQFQRSMKKAVRQHQESHIGVRTINTTPNKNRAPIFTHPNQLYISSFCDNHNDKNATHRFFSEESQQFLFYCEKCSIMLASQGFNVQKLPKDQNQFKRQPNNIGNCAIESPVVTRLNEIQDFLQNLQKYLQILSIKYTEVQDNLVCSQQQYNSLMQSITAYYDSLQQTLELQKYLSYNALLTRRNSQQSQLRILRDNVKNSMIQIQDMMNDIQSNLDAVQGVQKQIYGSIMQGYNEKLHYVPQIINFECKMPEEYSIMIPDIPEILSTLSDRFMLYPKGKTPNQPSKFINHQFQAFSRSKSREKSREIKQFYSHNSNSNVHWGSKVGDKQECLKKSQSQYFNQRVALGQLYQPQNIKQAYGEYLYEKQVPVQQYSYKNQMIFSKQESIQNNMRFSFESKDHNVSLTMSQSKPVVKWENNNGFRGSNTLAFQQDIYDMVSHKNHQQSDSVYMPLNS